MNWLKSSARFALGCGPALAVWTVGSGAHAPFHEIPWQAGERFFEWRCSHCHSLDSTSGALFGPNLAGIGASAHSRITGKSAEEYLIESILNPGAFRAAGESGVMPDSAADGFSRQQVASIAAYLMNQGSKPDYHRLARAALTMPVSPRPPVAPVSFADAEAGKELFLGKGTCAKCHAVKEVPGNHLRAPSLFALRLHDDAYLFESIRQPSKRISKGYAHWNVWLKSGTMHTGRLVQNNADSLEILEEAPEGGLQFVRIPSPAISTDERGQPMIRESAVSPMPDDLPVNDSEVRQIIAFLHSI